LRLDFRRVRQGNLKTPAPRTPRPKPFVILAALFDTSQTMEEIGAALGCTRERVRQVYQAARQQGIPGLPERPRGVTKAKRRRGQSGPATST
jgi:biotin operon repressor